MRGRVNLGLSEREPNEIREMMAVAGRETKRYEISSRYLSHPPSSKIGEERGPTVDGSERDRSQRCVLRVDLRRVQTDEEGGEEVACGAERLYISTLISVIER